MPNVVTILIIALTLAYVLFHLNSGRNDRVESHAYQWWYMPWFALLYTGLMYLLYNKANFPNWPLIRNIFEEYKVEGVFFVICAAIWTALEYFLLRDETIHEKLIVFYRQLFAGKGKNKDRTLPFPYFIDEEGTVRGKVGQVFYRWTMKSFVLFIAGIYILFYILAAYANIEFYLKSGLGLLGLIPLVDYYVYLCAKVKTENVEKEFPKMRLPSDFDELWQLYVDTFDNYSVAWKRSVSVEERKQIKDVVIKDGNDSKWSDLYKRFTDKHRDGIVENCDLVSAFTELEIFFDYVEKNGRYVLIAIDIPNHFLQDKEKSYLEEIADKLREVLKKTFVVYDGKSTMDTLNNSIVLAPLALVSTQNVQNEWMKKVGLITVVNLFDKNVANMYECRRFSFVLRSVNRDYQMLVITPHRRGVQPSIQNTWLTDPDVPEEMITPYPAGDRLFFIAYNYEDYLARFKKVLKSMPSEPLYSSTELATLALSSKVGEKTKIVTPIHYHELAYTNLLEGDEELKKFTERRIEHMYSVSNQDISKNVKKHLLPVERITEEQILNVVFDTDNNASIAYTKWLHLGYKENFTIVVSKPYLFRDYFNANHGFFLSSPFAAVQPTLSKSRVTLAIVLLNMLQNSKMEENELRDLLHYYYDRNEITSVSTLIRGLLTTYFSENLANDLTTEDVVDFDGEHYRHHIYYRLALSGNYDQHYLDIATVQDEGGNKLFHILMDLMRQNYVKGQIHSFSGKPFEIKDFSRDTRTLIVSKTNMFDKEIIFYKPCQRISLQGDRVPIKEMNPAERKPDVWKHRIANQDLSIEFDGFETNVQVETTFWYAFTKYTVFDSSRSESTEKPRKYSNGKVLKVSLNFLKNPRYLEHINEIRWSLQILLYEAMRSVFPQHAQYLIIASYGDRPIDPLDETKAKTDLPWIFPELICDHEEREGTLSYYFIEDAHIDLGLLGALSEKENIRYIFNYLYDYLIWLSEGEPLTSTYYDAYLDQKTPDKLAFLKYGRESLPPYFNIALLIDFIKDYYDDDKEFQELVIRRQGQHDFMGYCDFCGKEMENSKMTRLDDGRMRCPDCSIDAVDTNEQFEAICEKVKQLFKDHLGIDFSSIPHTGKLISAVDLHQAGGKKFSITNGYDTRDFVGLACDREDDIFYVENGRKPDDTLGIIAHEMTHIWQYNNEDFKKVKSTDERWVEGLAVWTDLFLSEKNGATEIEERRSRWLSRTDKYGLGLNFIMDTCADDPYGYIRDLASKIN
jgi:hypothetical protein